MLSDLHTPSPPKEKREKRKKKIQDVLRCEMYAVLCCAYPRLHKKNTPLSSILHILGLVGRENGCESSISLIGPGGLSFFLFAFFFLSFFFSSFHFNNPEAGRGGKKKKALTSCTRCV